MTLANGQFGLRLKKNHDGHWHYHRASGWFDYRRVGASGPARQTQHSDLADDRDGCIGAILGTVIARYPGVAVTPGIDWIEIALQVAVAAVGIAIVSGLYGRRHVNR
jgi:hypothetical protein